MACCKCCCGNKDCANGDQGKCCCGGTSGACCETNQYCCSGSCQSSPCCDDEPCVTKTYSASGLPSNNCSSSTSYGQETIPIPSGCGCVTITGSVDDDLEIDGSRIQANEFTNSTYPNCNPAHEVDYSFSKTGSFTLAVIDNYGSVTSYNLTICFSASCPGGLSLKSSSEPQLLAGPGTELKKLLAKIGITTTPDCQCNARARHMDEHGPDWCEQHIDEIVGWLREEAGKRGLPFVDIAGRLLVKKAISNARKRGQ